MRAFFFALAGMFLIAGCWDDDTGPRPPDLLLPVAAWEEVATPTPLFVEATLDYSCLGTITQPAPGATVSSTFALQDFQTDDPVGGVDVWLFTNNWITDTCPAADCQMFTTDASGNAMVDLLANGWYAYRVFPKMGISAGSTVFAVFQYNEPSPATSGQTVIGNSVSGSTIELIPATLGIPRTPGRALVAGRIMDCAEHFIQNVQIRLFDPDGNEIFAGMTNEDPHFSYFNGNAADTLPNQTQLWSNSDGLYVLVQVPVLNDRPYRVEAWGILDGTFQKLSCEAARIFPDAVTILNMTPMRSDAPAGC
jgi:hypothetical protein